MLHRFFFVLTYVVDLEFADRSRPTVKLGKFFYMSYGVSKLGRSLIFGRKNDVRTDVNLLLCNAMQCNRIMI